MNNTKKNVLSFILFFLFLIFALFFLNKNKKINSFEFPTTVVVLNKTHYDVDTLTKVFLNKVICMDSVSILYVYIPEHLDSKRDDELIYKAFIRNYSHDNKTYIIYLSRNINSGELKKTIVHELIHLKQYYEKELIVINDTVVVYKGDTLNLKLVEYSDRKYEIDAFDLTYPYINELNRILYK